MNISVKRLHKSSTVSTLLPKTTNKTDTRKLYSHNKRLVDLFFYFFLDINASGMFLDIIWSELFKLALGFVLISLVLWAQRSSRSIILLGVCIPTTWTTKRPLCSCGNAQKRLRLDTVSGFREKIYAHMPWLDFLLLYLLQALNVMKS